MFEDIACVAIVADVIRLSESLHGYVLFGFTIMPDHLHLLIQTQDAGKDISIILSAIKDNIYKRIRKEFSILAKILSCQY